MISDKVSLGAAMCNDLPRVVQFEYHDPPERKGIPVEFRLLYNGPLPAQSDSDGRVKQKNQIRSKIHSQLAELWRQHPLLRARLALPTEEPQSLASLAGMFKFQNKNNQLYRFVPLIGGYVGTACSLDILFLRRDGPGSLVTDGGDIDNRIKVLLDALRMPKGTSEMSDDAPGADEDPFHCLLEDDKYITDIRVTTDRLLTALVGSEKIHDVSLVIRVKTAVFDRQKAFPSILEMM
jgi:hypothetical protein